MHESLKRPLFKKKAMEVYQAKHGGIPKFIIGGIVPIAITGARMAAPYVARAVAPVMRAISSPTAQKLYTGAEVAGAASGAEEIRRAIKGDESLFGDQPASITGGLAALYPSVGFGGRTLKGAFPTSQMAATAGEKITKYTPFPLVAGFTGMPVSSLESGYREEKQVRDITPEKLDTFVKSLDALGPNATKNQYIDVIQNFDLNPRQKKAAYAQIGITDQDLKNFKKPEPTEVVTPKVPMEPKNQTENNLVSIGNQGNPNNMNPDEQDALAIKMAKQNEKANEQIKKLQEKTAGKGDDDTFAKEYNAIRDQIQKVTGSTDMTNLVLLKLASGLLTGKSRQGGTAGFLDVLGQAAGPAVDTAILLANQQKQYDTELAMALLKRKSDTGLIKAEQKPVYVQEINKDDPFFPVVGATKRMNKDTGTIVDTVQSGDPNIGEVFVPYTGKGQIFEPDEKAKKIADRQMKDRQTVIELAGIVENIDVSQIGPGARAKAYLNALNGTLQSYQSSFKDVDDLINSTYGDIVNNITNPDQYKGLSDAAVTSKKKETDKLLEQFQKENNTLQEEYRKALDKGDEEKFARAQLKLVEQRMKYVVANSNKFQDRLNAADVENARGSTEIFPALGDPRQIKQNYKALADEANKRFAKDAQTYVANGGTKDSVKALYTNVPWVQNYIVYETKKAGGQKTTTKKDTKTKLEEVF